MRFCEAVAQGGSSVVSLLSYIGIPPPPLPFPPPSVTITKRLARRWVEATSESD